MLPPLDPLEQPAHGPACTLASTHPPTRPPTQQLVLPLRQHASHVQIVIVQLGAALSQVIRLHLQAGGRQGQTCWAGRQAGSRQVEGRPDCSTQTTRRRPAEPPGHGCLHVSVDCARNYPPAASPAPAAAPARGQPGSPAQSAAQLLPPARLQGGRHGAGGCVRSRRDAWHGLPMHTHLRSDYHMQRCQRRHATAHL